jgi:glycine C-acetyltransferase
MQSYNFSRIINKFAWPSLKLLKNYKMYGKFKEHLQNELASIREAGLYKNERNIASAQSAEITLEDGSRTLNFCANNYLGLADSPRLIEAAKKAMDDRGFGMSSVRFICGTQDLHKRLEAAVSNFFRTEDTILYASCFDANAGVFEPLFTAEDAIISDSLNHASIIDGVRLCKAVRYRYANADMVDLEEKLKEARAQRYRIICTDGVFSMDGNVAPMDRICDLAEKYDALVMVDESHSAGVVGKTGRGVAELFDCYGRIDLFTGTLGKAFGGSVGGFTTGRKEIIDMLRQRSRPYLFSNSLPPMIVAAGIEMFKMLDESDELHDRLRENVRYFRDKMLAAGFDIKPTQSAIVAVMLYDAPLAQKFSAEIAEEGIFVTGFFYPVVPKGQARIRVQLSAAHDREHLDRAVAAFVKVGRALGVIE